MGMNIITDLDWLYYRNGDFIVIFGNTTWKYRCGLGNCMAVMDVKSYRLGMSVVVDCYKMQNVQIRGTKPLAKSVEYFCCNGTVLDINGQ
jgi:hypothetical protein